MSDQGVTGGIDKPWGGRFESEQDPLFERLHASIPFDNVLAPFDIAGSQAHVRMLADVGVLSVDDRDQILTGLGQIAREVQTGAFIYTLADEDIHMAIERRLIEIIGPVGGKMHTGRSRNDQVILDLHLYLRSAVRGHQKRVAGLIEALLEQAEWGKDTVMPGYTHMQRAQPVLLAHHLLALTLRLGERLASGCRSGPDARVSALGPPLWPESTTPRPGVGGRRAGVRAWARRIDAVAARDAAFSYLAVTANCALTLSRLAGELVLWSTQEYGLASLPESWTSGSSIMPQKRNPDGAELVRAKAAGFLARLQGLGAVLKGLPLAYNSDLQEDKPYVFASKEELDLCLEAMTAMVRGLTFDVAKARVAAEGGYAQATDVADYLAGKGLPFREAHWTAGRLVAMLAREGRPLSSASLEELRGLSPMLAQDYYYVVELDRVVAARCRAEGRRRHGCRAVGFARDRLKHVAAEIDLQWLS